MDFWLLLIVVVVCCLGGWALFRNLAHVDLDPRPAKRSDLKFIFDLGKTHFGRQVSSLNKMKEWFNHNDHIFWVVERVKRRAGFKQTKVVAYYSIVPLTKAATKLVLDEQLRGADFTTEHIAKHQEVAHAYYIGGIAAKATDIRAKGYAVAYLKAKVLDLEENNRVLFLTRPINRVGLRLVNRHDFIPAASNVTDPMDRVHRRDPQSSVTTPAPRPQSPKETVMKECNILLFTANPEGTSKLALDREVREIEIKIRASEHRDTLTLISKWAVQADDLLQALNEHQAHVVQFSSHGSDTEQLILNDKAGKGKPVSKQALSRLFGTLRGSIRLVVLNACFSRPQAEAIVEHIDCAIGMSKAIGDEAAITFASSFYRAIGFGYSVKHAFDQGLVALGLEDIPEDETPQLLVRSGVDAAEVYLVNPHKTRRSKPLRARRVRV